MDPQARRTLLTSALSLYAIQGLNYLTPLLVLPWVLRAIGATPFGVIMLAQAVIGYGVLLTDFGFNMTAARDVSVARADPVRLAAVYWTTQTARTLLALVSLVVLALTTALVPAFRAQWPLFVASSALLLGSLAFPQWYFQGLERLGAVAIPLALARILLGALTLWLVRTPTDAWLAALLLGAPQLAGALLLRVLTAEHRAPAFMRPTISQLRAALAGSAHMFGSVLSTTLYSQMNTLVLGLVSGAQSVAYYSLAVRLAGVLQTLAIPATQAVYPRAALLFSTDPAQAWALMRTIMRWLIMLVGGATLVLVVFAPAIVRAFAGPGFEAAVPPVRIVAFTAIAIASIAVPCQQILVSTGMTRPLLAIYLCTGLLNLALLAVLVPAWAQTGAALCLLISETLATCALAWLAGHAWRQSGSSPAVRA